MDIHCWIHKGSIGCCRELSEGIDTSKFVDYCVEMLKLLVAHGIKPIVGEDIHHHIIPMMLYYYPDYCHYDMK